MKRTVYKRGIALAVSCFLAIGSCFGGAMTPFSIVSYAEERTASVNATNLNVRSGPGTGYAAVAKLSHGAAVTVIGEQAGTDGVLWYQIRFSGSGGTETTGFVSSQYIKFPTVIANDSDFEQYLTMQGFPESYKPGLRELHAQYPQWTFTAFKTNLDWNTVIENESVIGRNLVSRDSISSWKSTAVGAYNWDTGTWPGFDGSSWVQASEDIIRYYMDPRNFLNDKYIYQFLKQSYDSSLHTRQGLESMVSGTFLGGAAVGSGSGGAAAPGGTVTPGGSAAPGNDGATGPGAVGPGMDTGDNSAAPAISPVASISSHNVDLVTTAYGPGMGGGNSSDSFPSGGAAPVSTGGSYVDIIMNAAVQSGVNPYILASMILQEQGSQGTGRSISGTVAGYEGYYNFFNIEAYQSGSLGAVERGLWWASQSGSYERPWNTVEKSILGGAVYYGNNYVSKGQNTLYLKKFNVQGSNLYKHQYMTHVLGAAAEGQSLSKVTALKNMALEFSIPVYNNMPDSACVKPTGDGSPNNKLSALAVNGFALTPTFNRDTESYDLIVDPSVADITISAAAFDSTAVVYGTGTVNLQSGNNEVMVSVKAGNGSVRNYVLHVVRQNNGPTYSGSIGGGAGPGGNSGNISDGNTNVEITGPPGTSSGSQSGGGQTGPIAPDGSGVNGFGKPEDQEGIKNPETNSTPGADAAPGYSDITMLAAGTTSVQAAAAYQPLSAGGVVKVYTSGGGEVAGIVGTGNLIQVYGSDGSPASRYEIIIKGDNTGDGKINILDILKAQRHILGLETISGIYEKASDINGNGKIDIMDILAMQKDVLGIQKLN